MNIKEDKPIEDFTPGQKQAFGPVMHELEEQPRTKQKLVKTIRDHSYTRKEDAVQTLKMFLKNPNVPIELAGNEQVKRQNWTYEARNQ